MNIREHELKNLAAVLDEAAAMSEAVLAGDIEEACFRIRQLQATAKKNGLNDLAQAAARLTQTLGRPGTPMCSGYGAGMLLIADALDVVAFHARE
ncbi:hypothetical protein BJI69_10590 [Luteibacter rhizovicinus DSM 16549]|uniref:Uncharacterized protein n=1 Tax=Luteibacter rhizovicinus DSM 16549 TaxID=1440763 RepID=A0A0G9H9B7_9GAMM|nr:hypothetical protein [Luteibacter rhizovicinus]APG04298.1 hypothetical protein BJI69_10590 [Luteibacter rhizovicinus DSM 16549]KLD66071.1 hypothetical protein Y883_15055 [Luteibacter rhizovicinus DSM 16549]KLD78769.1 hypothetical protein Y886_08305 [Xanthomonas hyacinthi DSM 19077]